VYNSETKTVEESMYVKFDDKEPDNDKSEPVIEISDSQDSEDEASKHNDFFEPADNSENLEANLLTHLKNVKMMIMTLKQLSFQKHFQVQVFTS
jgi:hypothetical protein